MRGLSFTKYVLPFCLLFTPFFAKAAVQEQALHLDEGFMGHEVALDLFDAQVRVRLMPGDLLKSSDVTVEQVSSTQWSIYWSSSYALSSHGFEFGILESSLADTTATREGWEEVIIETKKPFEAWKKATYKKHGAYLTVQGGPELEIRVSTKLKGLRIGTASWYRYKRCHCVASPDFPKGTRLRVWLQDDPTKWTVVRVNDYGPDRRLFPTRVVDLDSVAFKELSPLSSGLLNVGIEPLLKDDPRAQVVAKEERQSQVAKK
jgi:hypothetical protein